MKRKLLLVAVLFALPTGQALAQENEKAATSEKASLRKTPTPLRIQVVFNEFDGEKRISTLPYTLLVNADSPGPFASLRMGIRVPIRNSPNTFNYIDMGTNIDAHAERQEDGRFAVGLSVERSSAYSPPTASGEAKMTAPDQPVIQQFRSQINLLMRDGQTQQTTLSTDPVTGRVIKVDVTLSIVK